MMAYCVIFRSCVFKNKNKINANNKFLKKEQDIKQCDLNIGEGGGHRKDVCEYKLQKRKITTGGK